MTGLRTAIQRHRDAVATVDARVGGQHQPKAGLRKVLSHGVEYHAVSTGNANRQSGLDPGLSPHLTDLAGHRNRSAGNDDVVDRPGHVDDDGQGDRIVIPAQLIEAVDAQHEDHCVQRQQHDVRPRQRPVEEFLLDHAALVGHVEATEFRVDQRHQHRAHDVPGQHRLVDLVPERMAEAALNPRVGQAGVGQVRQHIGSDHQRRGVHDFGTEQQVRQWRGEKHQTRQAVKEVQHGVGVAQPLPQREAFTQ